MCIRDRIPMAQAGTHTIDGDPRFDLAHFLTSAGSGRRIVHCDPKNALFSQGDSADSVFYIQSGRLKVTVVSANGKEATITLLSAGDFIGENSLTPAAEHRLVTVTAITPVSYTHLPYRPLQQSPVSVEGSSYLQPSDREERRRGMSSRLE